MAEDKTDPKEPDKTEPKAEPKKDPPADKTFTQAELDRVVEERLARERKKFEGFDDIKARAEKFDELEAKNQSALEKAQTKAEKAEKERDEAVQRANQTLVRAAVVAEAAKQGAVDADAVVALLPGDQVTIGDDGQVTGAEQAVKGLLEAKQWLVGNTPTPPGDGGARTPVPPKDLDEQIREAEEKGDVRTSIALKNQKLRGIREQQEAAR
jgi:hypothetical protein